MKHIFITLSFLFFAVAASAQTTTYQLSTHILDITKGAPSAGVTVLLEKQGSKEDFWLKVDEYKTDNNGRIGTFLAMDKSDKSKNDGIYRLTFFTKDYFESQSVKTFYPFIQVVFQLEGDSHYHVPITLSPYGYSTYRGS